MDFRIALEKICNEFGKEILLEKRIISILADYGAFKDVPAYKVIYKLFLSELSLKEYINSRGGERQKLLMKQFVDNTGINEQKALELTDIILSVLSKGIKSPKANKGIPNSTNRQQETAIEYSDDKNLPQCSKSVETVTFLGITLDNSVEVFSDELRKRSAKIVPGRASKTFKIQSFLSYKNVKIELNTYEFSPVIKNIVVTPVG